MPHPRAHPIAAAALAVVLAGCGGGGGDSSSSTGAPAAGGAPAVTATVPDCGLANFQRDLVALINEKRAQGATCGSRGIFGVAPALGWNDLLMNAAEAHSRDMVAQNFFSHTGSSGSSMSQRIEAAGYRWSAAGENIAAGQSSVAAVVAGWMGSPGHCAIIMDSAYQQMGVACLRGSAGNAYNTYWTMNVAAPS